MNPFLNSLKAVAAKTQSPKLQNAVSEYATGKLTARELNRMAAAKPDNSAFFLTANEHFEVRYLTNKLFLQDLSSEQRAYL